MLFQTCSSRSVVLFGILVALSGCERPDDGNGETPSGERISVTDPTGRMVTLEAPAGRVVSMMPSATEWIVAMGASDRLVARTDYDVQPALDTLPSVGGGLTPSIEWLAALGPALVIAWPDSPNRSIVSQLEQVGIAVYTAPVESIDGTMRVARDLGTLLGTDAAADAAIAEVRAGLDSVRAAVTGRNVPDVLYLIGLDPLMAAGPGTFVDELLGVAGARNALHDLDILWPQLSMEEVVRRAPDVVVIGTGRAGDPVAALADRPGWRDVPAVLAGAVHAVDPNLVNRPGPRLAEAAALLADLIHTDQTQVGPSTPVDAQADRAVGAIR